MSYLKGTCGGIKFDETVFKHIGDVVTMASNNALVGDPIIPKCGGIILDGGVFEVAYTDGKNYVSLVDEPAPTDYIRANCSLLFDGDLFVLDKYGAISRAAIDVDGTNHVITISIPDTTDVVSIAYQDGDTWNDIASDTGYEITVTSEMVLFTIDDMMYALLEINDEDGWSSVGGDDAIDADTEYTLHNTGA